MSKRVWLREVYWYSFNGLVKSLWLLRHDLSIAKLEAYGLGNGILNFLLDYLTFRKQKTKVVPLIVNGQKLEGEFLEGQF